MAAITATSMQGSGRRNCVTITLSASDTFTARQGDVLMLRNPTGGTITATLTGDASGLWSVPGIGDVSFAAGRAIIVAASEVRVAPLDALTPFLQGTITVTGGAGLIATLFRS